MFAGDAGMMGGGQDFAAVPRLVQGQPKFKDPYGRNIEEYFPQNIMHDRRIMRGSTYAAMVIPAGTNPDAMVMDKNYPKKRSFKKVGGVTTKRTRNIYPNRDIPTPDPVPGRQHFDTQTDEYKELLTDKPKETEKGIATEFYLDRPPVPLFQPKMPEKECCKSTQIYEGDEELFNFNEEVEPMLNVLCSKTMEQARMEVLEEEEQAIIKSQQKEYEEIINAELIVAQRYEAAELRCKEESQRRKKQNKARKQEKKSAHEKINARILAKSWMGGLREDAMKQLCAQGVLVPSRERAMQEQVVPWLMNQIQGFLMEEKAITDGTQAVVIDGIQDTQNDHKKTIKAKYDRIKKEAQDKVEAEKQKVIRKAKRKELREKKAKDETLQRFKDQVYSNVILKGDKVTALSTNLVDMDGHFCSDKMLCTYGGQLQQIYYILEEIQSKYPQGLKMYMEKKISNDDEDYFARPNNARELLLTDHLLPFVMMYLKDMKNECIEVMLSPACSKFLRDRNIPAEEAFSMADEDALKFRDIFIEKKVSKAHSEASKQMDSLYEYLVDIATKRVLVETPNVKVDQVQPKVALVDIPEGIYTEDYTEEIKEPPAEEGGEETIKKVERKKNTDEMGVIVIKTPQIEEEEEVKLEADMDGEEKTEIIKKLVDEDQGGSAIVIQARDVTGVKVVDARQFYQINEYAAKAFREDFMSFIMKTYPEFFDDNNDYDEILQGANAMAQADIEKFVKSTCGEYEMPCMDFEIHAPDLP